MRCTLCGKNNEDSADKCTSCGASLDPNVLRKKDFSTIDNLSFLVLVGVFLIIIGIVIFSISIYHNNINFSALLLILNGNVVIYIESRIKRLEETIQIHKKAEKRYHEDEKIL